MAPRSEFSLRGRRGDSQLLPHRPGSLRSPDLTAFLPISCKPQHPNFCEHGPTTRSSRVHTVGGDGRVHTVGGISCSLFNLVSAWTRLRTRHTWPPPARGRMMPSQGRHSWTPSPPGVSADCLPVTTGTMVRREGIGVSESKLRFHGLIHSLVDKKPVLV